MTDSDRLRFAAFDLDGTLIDSVATIVDGVLACWSAETVRNVKFHWMAVRLWPAPWRAVASILGSMTARPPCLRQPGTASLIAYST